MVAYLITDLHYLIKFNNGDLITRIHHMTTISLIIMALLLIQIYHPVIARILLFEVPIIFLNIHILYFKDKYLNRLGTLNGLLLISTYLGFRLVNGIKLGYDYQTQYKCILSTHLDPMNVHAISVCMNILIGIQIYWSYKIIRWVIRYTTC